jgi:hypothetical protein
MLHPETHLVTKENGPRPAGDPDKCFYCGEPLGSEHKMDCVCRSRTVIVRYVFELPIDVPESWDKDMIEFARGGGGGWCGDNAPDDLNRLREDYCLCEFFHSEYVREATAEDEAPWKFAEPIGEVRQVEP